MRTVCGTHVESNRLSSVGMAQEDPDWGLVSFVLASRVRFLVLAQLRNRQGTPSQLAVALEKNRSHISRALSSMEKKRLVRCMTPDARKGRVYSITDRGERALDKVGQLTKPR